MISGTIVNNLEVCDIVKSSHFKMASQLLEVCVACLFVFSPKCKDKVPSCLCLTVFVPLPQVAPEELEKSLTQRSFMTARESVTKALTSAQAVDGRDAFVKVTSLTHDLSFFEDKNVCRTSSQLILASSLMRI